MIRRIGTRGARFRGFSEGSKRTRAPEAVVWEMEEQPLRQRELAYGAPSNSPIL